MESTLKNMILVLFAITLVAGAAVGLVYDVTKEPIEQAKKAKTVAALSVVLPEFDNDPLTEMNEVEQEGTPLVIYTARKGNNIVGYAVETQTNSGFGGLIKLMAGFRPDGEIIKIEALQHSETPGLGDKIESKKSNFSVQFEGKNPEDYKLRVKKDGGDVDGITASTISSRAYLDAVIKAYNAVMGLTGGQLSTDAISGASNTVATENNETEGGENDE